MNTCNLCGHDGLDYSESFWDANNSSIKVAVCKHCKSLIPEYINDLASVEDTTAHQVQFHEDWWNESSEVELKDVLHDVKELVHNLRHYLGQKNSENLVLELGSGRGSLLRALLDEGYSAYGCEPAPKLTKLARQNYALSETNLFNCTGEYFLENIAPNLPGTIKTFVLWHVLEHVKSPMQLLQKLHSLLSHEGCLILQLPLLYQQYIYPEHFFFPSHNTFDYIARVVGFQVEHIDYDLNNFFVTVCFRKSSIAISPEECKMAKEIKTMSPLSQSLFLRDKLLRQREMALSTQTEIIDDKVRGMSLMEKFIEDRDKTIAAQTSLIDDKVRGMSLMEKLIEDRDKTITAQAALIDDKIHGMSLMEKLIEDRDKTITTQSALVDDNVLVNNKMKLIIDEKAEIISHQINTINSQTSIINEQKLIEAELLLKVEKQNELTDNQLKIIHEKTTENESLIYSLKKANEAVTEYEASLIFKIAKFAKLVK